MFDLFDFTPVKGDPFQDVGTDMLTGEPPPVPEEGYAKYAGDPSHPMESRIMSALVEEARRTGLGLKNSLQTFMGPMYGEGHVPQFNEMTPEQASGYAGAGINLASQMTAPGGETGLGAGWNPKALEYLQGVLEKKPLLLPETQAAVHNLLSGGTEIGEQLSKDVTAPGAGFATIAGLKHGAEQKVMDEAAATKAAAEAKAQAAADAKAAAAAAKAAAKTKTAPAATVAASVNGWSPKAVDFLQKNNLNPHFMDPADVGDLKINSAVITPADEPWLKALDVHTGATKPKPGKPPATPTPAPAAASAAAQAGVDWSPTAKDLLIAEGLDPTTHNPYEVYHGAAQGDPLFAPGSAWKAALAAHKQDVQVMPVPAAPAVAAPATTAVKAKKAPTVASTPMTAAQALSAPANPHVIIPAKATKATSDAQLNQLFSTYVPQLQVPKMKPYDPTVPMPAQLAHETAPGTSGMTTPFNPDGLPMDKASVVKRMTDLGFGPIGGNWLFWRGVAPHGPFSWDSAAVGYKNPAGKNNEPGLFFAPNANAKGKPGKPIATMYGSNVNAHVIRSSNPLVAKWKDIAGGSGYSSSAMQKAIKDAWAKGHDALLVKDINDLGGTHDQMVVRNANQVRHPHAAFNPKYKDLPNLLAGGGLGIETAPLVAQDQEMGNQEPNALGWGVTQGGVQ